jgi:hypothetical protein
LTRLEEIDPTAPDPDGIEDAFLASDDETLIAFALASVRG